MTLGCSYYKSVSVISIFKVSRDGISARENTRSKHKDYNSADASAAQTRAAPRVKLFMNTVLVLRWVEK